MHSHLRRLFTLILYAIPILFLLAFFFYPLVAIFRVSFFDDGTLKVGGIIDVVRSSYFWRLLWFTTWQALLSTILTLIFGLPLAYVFARYEFRGKGVLRALTIVPFVMPTVVVAAAFSTLLGNNGLLNSWLQALLGLDKPPIQLMQTIWMILLAHVFFNTAVIVRTVGGFWANINPHLSEAAAVLGAGRRQLWREVTLPLLLPSILAASLLVFLFCFTSFGVILILGGLRFATIEVEIYRQAVSLFNLPVAAFLSLVQMMITLGVMALYTRLQARASRPLSMRPTRATTRQPSSTGEHILLYAALGIMLLLLLAPLLTLAWRSFTLGENAFTLQFYRALGQNQRQSAFFVTPITAVRNSLLFATATMGLSLLLGVISAYLLARPRGRLTTVLDPLFLLPLGASAITLGFGYIVSMGTLRTSLLLVPIAHTLIAMPFVIRTFLPALRSLDPRLRESATVLGAGSLQRWWRIDVPILYRALLVSAIFAFTISLGEFGASLLVSRPDVPTMPVVIYRALGQPGLANYGQALAMSTILMVVAAAAVLLIERIRIGDIGEF